MYLPHAFDVGNVRLSTHHTFCTDFQRHSSDFSRQGRQTRHHLVDSGLQLQHLTLNIDLDHLAQIATSDSLGDFGDRPHLIRQVACHPLHIAGTSRTSSVASTSHVIDQQGWRKAIHAG